MASKKFRVSMNLAQALIAMGACYDERRLIGNRTIEEAWPRINESQLDWLKDQDLIPDEAVPEHTCYYSDLPREKQSLPEKCPHCQFYERPVAKIRADLLPWLPNIAKALAEKLADGDTSDSSEAYITLEDPILAKPSYKKPPEPKKVVAKKTAVKKTANAPHKVRDNDRDFY